MPKGMRAVLFGQLHGLLPADEPLQPLVSKELVVFHAKQ
jgi:hypothetical protein